VTQLSVSSENTTQNIFGVQNLLKIWVYKIWVYGRQRIICRQISTIREYGYRLCRGQASWP